MNNDAAKILFVLSAVVSKEARSDTSLCPRLPILGRFGRGVGIWG